MLVKSIRGKCLAFLAVTTVHLGASVLPTPISEDNVRGIGRALQIGKKNQAQTAVIYRLCRMAFLADDASRANAVGDLLSVLPEYAADYDTVSDIFQTIFANSELLTEYIQYLPHLIHETPFLTFCMGQPTLKDQLTKIGFSPDITRAQAKEGFASVGHKPVNEIYLSLLSQLLSFGVENETVKNACKDLLNVGRNTPRNASESVERLLTVIPENGASYGNLFVSLRNLSLDQSHFMERLDLLKAEIDLPENRAKHLTSALLKLTSKSKSDKFFEAVSDCLKTGAEPVAPGTPPAARENALKIRVRAIMDLFFQFPPERTTLARCLFEVCDNPDAFYPKLYQLQQTMAGPVDQSILFARAFTRFDDVVTAMDECLTMGTTTALSKICFSQPRRPDTILALCANRNLGGLISALHSPEPTNDEIVADVVVRLICNDLRSVIVSSFQNCQASGLASLELSITNMVDTIKNALQGIVTNSVRSFLFVDKPTLDANVSSALQRLGF
jgi:hypothetical protein